MDFSGTTLAQKVKKILLIHPGAIGDVVLLTPMLTLIRERFPHAKITVLCRTYTKDLLQNHPNVDGVILDEMYAQNLHGIKHIWKLAKELRAHEFDIVIHVFTDFRFTFASFLAGIPIRIGDGLKIPAHIFLTHKVPVRLINLTKHTVEMNVDLLAPLGITPKDIPSLTLVSDANAVRKMEQLLRQKGLPQNKPLVAIHLGTGGNNRAWHPSSFKKLVEILIHEKDMNIVLAGDKREILAEEEIVRQPIPRVISFVNKITLQELVALIQLADIFICGDTGPLHIGAALHKNIVGIYPSKFQKPSRWAPWKAPHILLHHPWSCPLVCIPWKCKESYCLDSIPPKEAAEAVTELISGRGIRTDKDANIERWRNSITVMVVRNDKQDIADANRLMRMLQTNGFHVVSLNAKSPKHILRVMIENDTGIIHTLPGVSPLKFRLLAHLASSLRWIQTPPMVFVDLGKPIQDFDTLLENYRTAFADRGQFS